MPKRLKPSISDQPDTKPAADRIGDERNPSPEELADKLAEARSRALDYLPEIVAAMIGYAISGGNVTAAKLLLDFATPSSDADNPLEAEDQMLVAAMREYLDRHPEAKRLLPWQPKPQVPKP